MEHAGESKRNRSTPENLTPFVGRSRGVIHASADDLMSPVGEDWEVGCDLPPHDDHCPPPRDGVV
jgi:hypothetical protein